ncbi:hypothetical protein FRC01_013527, partial [Tulasnella sp. 417]
MAKLAHRRLDPGRIEFPEDGREFRGGHATVSKGCMRGSLDTGGSSEALGRSGMLGRFDMHGPLDIELAVKKMRIAEDTDLERALGLAVREAQFLEGLMHPNIVRFKGFAEDISNGIIWLVFPWFDNGNLKDFVALLDWEIPERISL